MSAAPLRVERSRPLGNGEWGRSLLGETEASVQGRPGGPASRTGRAAHGRAAGTRPLSSLRQENKQKAGRLIAGTTGRFPWEVTLQLPSLALRVPAPRVGRPGRGAAALHSRRGVGQSPGIAEAL